jgi:hypothetical protein
MRAPFAKELFRRDNRIRVLIDTRLIRNHMIVIRTLNITRPVIHLVTAALLLIVSNAHAQTLVARYTPVANFAYQLDCVAGLLFSCAGRGDYEKLWRETFNIDPATSNEVKRWRELRRQHERLVQPNFNSIEPGWPFTMVSPNERVLVAGLGARDLADYQSRLALLMHDSYSADAAAIVATLYAPFEKWWKATPTPPGHVKAQEIIARMSRDDMRDELRMLNAFYGNPAGARREATIHLMFRPGIVNGDQTGGQNIGVDSFAEFMADEDLVYRIPVIVHEYAHFVFGTTPIAQARALRNAILKEGGEIGGPAWGLLNEALATAIGNGRAQRLLISASAFERFAKQEGSFYSDPFIDGAGKALVPILDQMAKDGQSIHSPQFATRYVGTLKATFGAKLNSPAAHLNELVVAIDPAIDADRVLQTWRKHIRSSSRWDYQSPCCDKKFVDELNSQNGVTRVAMIPTNAIERATFLSPNARTALFNETKKSDIGIYIARPANEPPLIVVAFNRISNAAIESALASIAKIEELREGLAQAIAVAK